MKLLKLTLITALCLTFGACVRFTDARAKLIKEDRLDPAADRVGIDAFYRYDREQRTRLKELINSRLSNISKPDSLEYRIGPGDELTLYVMNFEEVSRDYKVAPDGSINLPFVGKVKVKGSSEQEAAQLISKKLEGFVLDPVVTVEVSDYSAYKVWLIRNENHLLANSSASLSRNAFPLKRPLYPLIEFLMEAGNIDLTGGVIYLYPQSVESNNSPSSHISKLGESSNPFCNPSAQVEAPSIGENGPNNCRTFASGENKKYDEKARIQIDIEELFGGISNEPLFVPLLPGDIVVVPRQTSVQVYGEVFQRGGFSVGGNSPTGSIVKPSLLSVISAARGFTYSADINQIEIFRELEFGKKVVLTVDFEELVLKKTQDVRLRDGDVVWVPSHETRFYEEHSIRAINSLLGATRGVESTVE